MKKRVFALLLCLVLCLSILPVGAFAEYCEHDIVKMEAKATCGEAYREHYKCTKCGKLFSDERGEHEISYAEVALEKPVHTSDLSHVEFKDASCTESGNYEYWVCTECGQMFSENPGFEDETDNRRTKPVPDDKVKDYTIEPYGHNLVFHEAVPHTCTQDGTVAYYQCTSCGLCFSDPDGLNPLDDIIDHAPGHVKTEHEAVDHTCDTNGNTYYFYCEVCGKYYNEYEEEIAEDSWVDPARHDYEERPLQEPTCTAAGNRPYYICSGCGSVLDADLNETTLEAVTLGIIPHSLDIHVPAAAKSCYLDGNVEYWQCTSCGAKFADAEGTLPLKDDEVVIPACHEFEATPEKKPTCTEPGNIAFWTCTAEGCGIMVDESGNQVWETAVPATGHKPVKVERTTTCTEAGTAEHYKCEACGKLFQDETCTVEITLEDLQEVAPGHEYDADGVCTRCGAISPDTPAFEGRSPVDVPTPQGTWQRVVVHVTAPQGVFPAGAQLSAQVVVNVDAETQAAVDAAREGATPARAYTFDVKVLNRYGYEVQPADGSKVNVSFALAEATNKNMNATVYHVTEAEDGSKSAEALETSVETVEGAGGEKAEAVVAETDGFSYFTVEFTCEVEEPYILPGGESVALETILNKVLEDPNPPFSIIDVTIKDEDKPYFEAIKNDNDVWIVYSYQPFSDEKNMIVKLWDNVWGEIEYIIKVTDAQTFDVSFVMNNAYATQIETQQVEENGHATRPATDPTTLGYEFVDWFADIGLTTRFVFTTQVITGPTTVYAKWNPNLQIISGNGGTAYRDNNYEFTLNCNYNQVHDTFTVSINNTALAADKYEVTKGANNKTVVTLKKEYIRTLEAGTYSIRFNTGITDLGYKDGTFKVPVIYTVTFDKNKRTDAAPWPANISIEAGKTISRPTEVPTSLDYDFVSWCSDAKGEHPVTFPLTINGNTTIYGKWKIKTYQVVFDTKHGTAPKTQVKNSGDKAVKPADLSWIGYKWGGWYTDKAWKNAYDFKTPVRSNITLYAKWIPEFKITKGDGGTAHYGSNYEFTLNYAYSDYSTKKNEDGIKYKDLFEVWVRKQGTEYSSEPISKDHYVVVMADDKRVKVMLKINYIKTLTDGATYDIWFDTGLEPYEYDAKYYPPIDLGATVGTFKVSKSPKTGDESNVGLWIAIAAVSAVGLIAIAAYLISKRKKSKKSPTPPENRPADKTKKPPKE